jgi:hypothetical protein
MDPIRRMALEPSLAKSGGLVEDERQATPQVGKLQIDRIPRCTRLRA